MFIKKVSLVLVLALVSLFQLTSAAQAAASDWEAKYWTNTNLSGEPALVRQEGSSLDHNWGADDAPGNLDVEAFSARFKRTLNVPAGTYRFTATMDDGLRFWIDGVLVIDSWTDSQVHSLTADYHLSGGDHNLKVEYYDAGGAAVVKLSWVAVNLDGPSTISNWRGEYFNNPFLAGTPSLVRDDANLNFNWGTGAPAAGIGVDAFSVRWTRNLNLEAGRYRFSATADDGVRVWVNGQLLINKWQDQAATTFTADVDLAGGSIPVQMEYYDNQGGASAALSWQKIGGSTTAVWKGEYFNNTSLTGSPVLVRDDANIAFDWGSGSPATSVNKDNFSVRWSRTFTNSPAGKYRFTATADDGVRVWVNGQLVINAWSDHTPQDFVSEVDFAGGNMNVVMEYYENTGGARANLVRTQVTSTNVPTTPVTPPVAATATVASQLLNVRSGPAVTNPVIQVLNQGQTVSLLARNATTTWIQVITPTGTQGWVYGPLLSSTYNLANLPVGQGLPTTPPPSGPVATISNAVYALNVRSGPGVSFGVVTAVARGTQVSLIGRTVSNSWLKIRLADGTEGWSSANYLTTTYAVANLPVVSN
ncbi:MAG: SH3 domain-containing protein [Ardenticatenaceae bacterium]|nr:SH3 domain-containing protein [Ardenticatenaceae bacterium]MCB8946313.1 SH3 domain-containing protein [Ardenticatenaceae bacterium]